MIKRGIAVLSMLCMLFMSSSTIFANENYIVDISNVQCEMDEFINETELPMEVENFTVTLREDVDLSQFTPEEISALLEEDIETMKRVMVDGYYNLTSTPRTRLANLGNGEYTAEVWAGVPSIGWSTVKQDFSATISGGKVTSITFLGDSYMDGVSWGQYSHVRSWYDLYIDDTKVDIYMKGTINYLFNLINSNYTATFLEELEVSGNSLVRQW